MDEAHGRMGSPELRRDLFVASVGGVAIFVSFGVISQLVTGDDSWGLVLACWALTGVVLGVFETLIRYRLRRDRGQF